MAKQMYQTPRGTKDILPTEQPYWSQISKVTESTLQGLGFNRLDLPHFEAADIYSKGIGTDSDIVSKEMFFLEPRTDDETIKLALRPEGTAGAVRSYIQNGMSSWSQPVRLYYSGAMFRRERPQRGRYREFYQTGVEIFGDETAKSDYLVIMSAWEILNRLGLKDLIVYTNSIGCAKCRPKYLTKLKNYYKDKLDSICSDCKNRFETNPLRLLDCKEENCQKIAKDAPLMLDNLCTDCKDHFRQTLEYLDYFNIRYDLAPTLVRGLDYYSRTVFEIVQKSDTGRKNTLVGGGRYDGLVELLGGNSTPAVGYSIGIERVINAMKDSNIKVPKPRGVDVCILQLGDRAREVSKKIYDSLTKQDINVYFVPDDDGIRPQIKNAVKLGATYAVIIGQKEALNDEIILRDLNTSSQEVFTSSAIAEEIKNRLIKCECKID